MSARLISLAVNIALMGFVLVNGIFTYLKGSLPGSLRPPQLHSLAEKIAAGDVVLSDHAFPVTTLGSEATTHAALVHGFGLVMLYGGVGVWILAATSFIIFRVRTRTCSQHDSTTLKGNRIAGSTTDVAVVQYFNRLKEATDRGQVIVARRTAESLDKTFGIVVFEAKDQEAALKFMNADPAMHAGVMTAELHPFSVSLARKNPE